MIIGIDGGGTKTHVLLANSKGDIIDELISGPSSLDTVGFKNSITEINNGILELIIRNNVNYIESIFGGIGGIVTNDDSEKYEHFLYKQPYTTDKTIIEFKNDVYNAFYGALDKEVGIVCIAGTGSVCFGIDRSKHTHRSGGYCFQEGDLGSSYAIGRDGILYLSKTLDGRRQKTDFSRTLQSVLDIESYSDAANVFMELFNNRTKTASLAKIVGDYAELNESEALNIIEKATSDIIEMVNAVYTTLEFTNPSLSIVGSLGVSKTYFSIYQHKAKELGIKHVHLPKDNPGIGSIKKALMNKQKT